MNHKKRPHTTDVTNASNAASVTSLTSVTSSFCSFLSILVASFLCVPFIGSCTSKSASVDASIPPGPLEDEAYAKELNTWRKSAHVNEEFQKKIDAEVVMFSDAMRKAYAERWTRLRGDTTAEIAALTGGKLAFFVSVFSPESDFMEVDNNALWTIQLRRGSEVLVPVLVKKLWEKSAFVPFFPFVNHWTKETLVVFEASSSVPGSTALVKPVTSTLEMRSALAALSFTW